MESSALKKGHRDIEKITGQIFSITTSMAIMKMNTRLGFEPVTFENIVQEDAFWQGCQSCMNYSILQGKQCKN